LALGSFPVRSVKSVLSNVPIWETLATDSFAGGVAVVAHGHVRATVDLDVCYVRTSDNLERSKGAVGRAEDLLDLEAIRELRRGGG